VFDWLRRRKAEPTDAWTIARTEEDSRTVLLRFRSFAPAGVNTSDYPHLVNIYWRYDGDANDGMPAPDLHQRMCALESRLDAIEGMGIGFLVLSVTGNNRKEWVWYVADESTYMVRVNEALSAGGRFPVEFESTEDPDWSNFTSLLAAVRGPTH